MLGWNSIFFARIGKAEVLSLSVRKQLLLEPHYYWFWPKTNVQNIFGNDTRTERL